MLADQDQQAVTEEESLLARVRERLSQVAAPARATSEAQETLAALRDEASTANAQDLPSLFEQMHRVRALAEQRSAVPLPDPACPYFAHLRIQEGKDIRDYLLGQVTWLDTGSGLRILDWRNAPLAQLFYRHQEGERFEVDLPRKRMEGTVLLRRVVAISNGRLHSVLVKGGMLERAGDGTWHKRGALTAQLSGGEGSAQRGQLGVGVGRDGKPGAEIAALLDQAQFSAIQDHMDSPLLVLGVAGSGKTTVAAHRLAVLAHQPGKRIPADGMRVVVPEPGVARLWTRMLERLGLGDARAATVVQWLHAAAKRTYPALTRRLMDDAPTDVATLKRHPALLDCLPAWLAEHPELHALEPAKLRVELLAERLFLRRVVAASNGDIPATAVDNTARRTIHQAALRSEQALRHVDAERLKTLDGGDLDSGTPDDVAGSLDEEDLAILLELARLAGTLKTQPHDHLVVDEAQDIAAVELRALRQDLGDPPGVTVAGDDLQHTSSSGGFAGWDRVLTELGAKDAERVELQVGYRCPAPIAHAAQRVLGEQSRVVDAGGRPGAPVGWFRLPHLAAQVLFLQDALTALLDREPHATIGILTADAPAAKRWALDLERAVRVRLVVDGEFTFTPGVDVCEVRESKGLEFDYVIIPDGSAASYPDTPASRRRMHVAMTRAMHQLWVCCVGSPSPLLGGLWED